MTAPRDPRSQVAADCLAAWASVRSDLGASYPATLDTTLESAWARHSDGDCDGAMGTLAFVTEQLAESLGAHHPQVLRLVWQHLRWRLASGDPEAVGSLHDLTPVLVAILGEDNLDSLSAQYELATVLDGADVPADRLLRWVRLCAAARRGLGYWHVLTMAASHGAAGARHDLGDLFGATNEMMAVYNHRKAALGERHVDTLVSQLGAVVWQAEAAGLQATTLENLDFVAGALSDVAGPDHPNTLAARFTRAAWTPTDRLRDIDLCSEWEVLVEDLARIRGPEDPMTRSAEEHRQVARANWQKCLAEIREIAYDLYIDMESEDEGTEIDEDRGWMESGNLDADALERVADDADEQESLLAAQFDHIVAVKRAYFRCARGAGPESLEALQWRYFLAWLLLDVREFDSAAQRATALVRDCDRLLGAERPFTDACRRLLQCADSRSWGLEPAYWRGDPASADPVPAVNGELLAQIRTRLNPPLPPEHSPTTYARPAFDGLVIDLNLDLPDAVQTLSDHQVSGHDLDLLYEVGQRNTDAEPMDIERLDHDVVALMGESFFIASKALNMPALIDTVFGGSAPLGVIFSVPQRGLLLLHAVGPQVMEALQWIVPVTIGQAREAAGPISPDTYYWHNGRVQRITQRDVDGDATGILIDGAFADAIDRVAAAEQG